MRKIENLSPNILLDTHIWIWLVNGDVRIKSTKFLNLVNEAAGESRMCISIISIWEVAMLEAKKRISFPYSCLEWVQRAFKKSRVRLIPLTPEIAIESTHLDFHGDPADRIIVATALDEQAVLVSCDQNILTYSQKNNIKIFSP